MALNREQPPIDPLTEYLIPDLEEVVTEQHAFLLANQPAEFQVAMFVDPTNAHPVAADGIAYRLRQKGATPVGDFMHTNARFTLYPSGKPKHQERIIEYVWANGRASLHQSETPHSSFILAEGFHGIHDGIWVPDKEIAVLTEESGLADIIELEDIELAINSLVSQSRHIKYTQRRTLPLDINTTMSLQHEAIMQKISAKRIDLSQELGVSLQQKTVDKESLSTEEVRHQFIFRRQPKGQRDKGWRFVAQYDSRMIAGELLSDLVPESYNLQVPSVSLLDRIIDTLREQGVRHSGVRAKHNKTTGPAVH